MKKIINFRPITFIALSLCCGIATVYFIMRGLTFWAIFFPVVFVACLSLYVFLFSKKESRKISLIFAGVFLFFYMIGGAGVYTQFSAYQDANLNGRIYTVSAKVEKVNKAETATKLILSSARIDGIRIGNLYYKISLSVYGDCELDVGDLITFTARLSDSSYLYEDRFNANDVERGIKYYAGVSSSEITKTGRSLTIFESINLFIRDSLRDGLSGDEFAIAIALLTGNSSYMDNELASSFRTAGVAHIFAVSGLHIGFLAAVLTFIFKKLKVKKTVEIPIIVCVLLVYSGVCGFTASSLRATVMTAVSLIAIAQGERYDGLSSVSFSAILILLVSPTQLLCVGFQLSFAVVIGIIVLAPTLARAFKFLPEKTAKAVASVISAQIFSIPICLYAFGKVSLVAVLVNLIFIPVVSFIFILTLITALLGGIFSISSITLFPSSYILKAVKFFIGFFDSEFFNVAGVALGGGALFYYLTALVASGLFNFKKRAKIIVSCCMAFLLVFTTVMTSVIEYNSTKIYVSSAESISATLISKKDQNVLIVSDLKYIYSTAKLGRVANSLGQNQLESVVLMGGYIPDLQVFISKLRTVFTTKRLYYYGQKDESMENLCKASFSGLELYNYEDGHTLNLCGYNLPVVMNGLALIGEISGKRTAIFSSLPDNGVNFDKVSGNFDIMICADRAESIISKYSPKTGISYKFSSKYLNAQSSGYILLKLS